MSQVPRIPLSGDVAELVGISATQVENRSLLLDKFVFHKRWPVVEEQTSRGRDFVKWDEATRWSFLRIANGATVLLNRDAAAEQYRASGRNVLPENKERFLAESRIAKALAGTTWDASELARLRASHTRRFLGLFRKDYPDRSAVLVAELKGRLAINLADSLIQNAGICLDRMFGLPFIPGSALKGVCRHAALEELRAAPDLEKPDLLKLFCAVFGTSTNDFEKGDLRSFSSMLRAGKVDQKGSVSFLPAYPVGDAKIVVDLTNVHYPDYYRSGDASDLRKENPRPNPFPAVEVGTQFAFCLLLNRKNVDDAVLAAAKRWLEVALTQRGVGAKTSSGYGWFAIRNDILEVILEEEKREAEAASRKAEKERADREAARAEEERKAALCPEAAAAEELLGLGDEGFANFAKQIGEKEELYQRAFVSLLRENTEKRERWKTWKKRKPDLAKGINEVSAKLNLPPLP